MRVERVRRQVNFRAVVDTKRGQSTHRTHLGGKIGEAPAIQRVVSNESDHLAGRPIDPDPRPHLEGMSLYPGLKLLEAVVG